MDEKKHLSWEEFHLLVRELADAVAASGYKPDFLIGVTRGGLVPLAMLGEIMGTKDVATISARSYSYGKMERNELKITCLPDIDLKGKKILLVDEITDSGETFRQIATLVKEKYQPGEVRTAVVVTNIAHCKHKPDYSIMNTDVWVVFPWQEWPRKES